MTAAIDLLVRPEARGSLAEAWARCPVPWSVKPSPDGRWVAWAWAGPGPAADIYLAPTDGSAPPRRLAATPEHSLPRAWTADGRALVVAEHVGGDERDRLFLLRLDEPGRLVPLTAANPTHLTQGGQLHPNGRWLVYAANLDAATGRVQEGSWIYRHDLETGERRVLARRRRGDHYGPALNPQGTHLVYHRHDRHPAGSQVWVVDIEGREDRELLDLGPRSKLLASWFPDGRRLLLLAEAGSHVRVGMLDLADGALRWLLDDPARMVEWAVPSHDGAAVMLIEVREARVRPSLLELASGRETPLALAGGTMGNLLPVGGLPGGDWIALGYSARRPTDILRIAPGGGRPPVSLARPWQQTALRPSDFTPAEDFRWRSSDGLPIQGWLYRTRRPVAKGTIVWIHGGPTFHSEDEVNPLIQHLCAEGFDLLDPNYRGSTGFGLPFREAIKADGWGGREQEDIRTGLEALVAAGLARPGRIGVGGVSYGGYSALCAVTRWPALVAAAVSICGMTDLAVDYHATELPHGRLYSEEMMGAHPDEAPELYRRRSPLHHFDRIRGRLLLVHGLRDPNVSPANLAAAQAALEAAGVPYELLTFADEGHGVWKRENRRRLFERLAAFYGAAFAATR